jgi:thioredoxin 1
MKNIQKFAEALIVLTLLILCIGGCAKDTTGKAVEAAKDKNRVKVTFIELGSVKCVPCKMMQPVMEKIEKTYPNDVNVIFYDVWTEEEAQFAKSYGIKLIPTQIFLDQDGVEYFRHEGFFPFEEIVEVLQQKDVSG